MSVGADDIELEDRVAELIERGLERYGRGDLEGALSEWRHALVLEPDERRALEYVAYVEKHYELLDGDHAPVSDPRLELTAPFGIEVPPGLAEDELDAYESIEILAGEPTDADRRAVPDDGSVDVFPPGDASAAPLALGDGPAVDDGWTVEDEASRPRASAPSADSSSDDGLAETADLSSVAAALPEPSAPAAGDPGFRREETQEGTVPGGRTPPPLEHSALSTDALDALGGAGDLPHGVDPFEPTLERSTALAGDLELSTSPLGEHGADLPAFEDRDTPTPVLPGDDEEDDDEEDTNFRVRGRRWTGGDEGGRGAASDEELTAERGTETWHGAAPAGTRAPTEDPDIDADGLDLDDALLSLEDATRELDIRDVSDPEPREVSEAPAEDASAGPPGLELELELDPGPPQGPPPAGDPGDQEVGAALLAEVDADAPADESDEQRLRRRVQRLLDRADRDLAAGDARRAVLAAELAIGEHPDSVVVQKAIADRGRSLQALYASFLGDLSRVPMPALSLAELSQEALDHRAGFLLSRVDGSLSFDDLLDVSGMPRLEALRHLSRLVLRGILDVQ